MKKISLQLSDKAFARLKQSCQTLSLSADELATICFEYVDVEHPGIQAAARKIKQGKTAPKVNKQNLEQHLKQLSSEQIERLLTRAAQKKNNSTL